MKLMIRKVQYAPETQGPPPPSAEVTKDFVMSDKPLLVKAALDKQVRSFIFILEKSKLRSNQQRGSAAPEPERVELISSD